MRNLVGSTFKLPDRVVLLSHYARPPVDQYCLWNHPLGAMLTEQQASLLFVRQSGEDALIEVLARCGVTASIEEVTDTQWAAWEHICDRVFFADFLLGTYEERDEYEFSDDQIAELRQFLENF